MAGRPPMISSPEEMQEKIDQYFKECDKKKRPYTVPGLALALGFSTRQSLLDYAEKDEFVDTIKKAKLKIEAQRNDALIKGSGSPAGMIFDLKNNFGWKDKQEIEHSIPGGEPPVLTNLELAARLAYLVELAARRKREQEQLEGQKALELPDKSGERRI